MRTALRTLQILDLFSVQQPRLRASEAAALLGLDRATCFRLLQSLAEMGYVTQDSETKRYELGPAIIRLGRIHEATTSVTAGYDAVLQRLTEATRETTHASLIAGREIASIAVCDGLRSNRVHHRIGSKLAWHATASGLTCLAFLDDLTVETLLRPPLEPYTDRTLTSSDAVARERDAIRARGYGVVRGCFDADVTGIAAPVFGHEGQVRGAISVITPSSRMTDALEQTFSRHAITAAAALSDLLSGRPRETGDTT